MMLAASGKRARLGGSRAVFGVVAVALGVFLALGSSASPAEAHADLLETLPADGEVLDEAPEQIELRFNEPVQLIEGATRLFPGGGTPSVLDARVVDTTLTAALPPSLGEGAYTVAYRIVSADGHPVGGAISFQIGEGPFVVPHAGSIPADPVITETAVSILTFAQYLGLLVFTGLVFFEHAVRRSPRRPAPRTRRVLRYAIGAAAFSSLLLIPMSGSRVTGTEFVTFLADQGDLVVAPLAVWLPGVSWQVFVSAAVVTVLGVASYAVVSRSNSRLGRIFVAFCAIALLATPVLVGHTQTVRPVWAMQLADFGHLVAGAFWVGGVIGLVRYLAAAQPFTRGGRPQFPAADALTVVATFSRFALYSVLVLGASGILMGYLIIGSWEALLTSGYGRLLLIKLGIVAIVVALAARNRLQLLPRIARMPGSESQWAALRRMLRWEAVLLVAVIAVTGFLTNTSPVAEPGGSATGAQGSPSSAPRETSLRTESQGLSVDGTLTPTAIGPNEVQFRLEYNGAPISTEEVRVDARLPEQELGPFTATPVFNAGTGQYEASLTLPIAGEWQIQVFARIDAYTQPIAIIPVTIP